MAGASSSVAELCAFTFFCSLFFFSSLPQATCLTHCRTGFRARSWYLYSSCWPTKSAQQHRRRPVLILPPLTLRSCLCSPWLPLFLSTATLRSVSSPLSVNHVSFSSVRASPALFTLCNAVICCVSVWNLVLAQSIGLFREYPQSAPATTI